jgi:hypothetical protein
MTSPSLPRQVCWDDILKSPFFLRYRIQDSGSEESIRSYFPCTNAWSMDPIQSVNCICRIRTPTSITPLPHAAFNSDIWAQIIEYVGFHIEVCRSCPAYTPTLSHHGYTFPIERPQGFPHPARSTTNQQPNPNPNPNPNPRPIYGPVNWNIDRFMLLHNEVTPYYGGERPLHYTRYLSRNNKWSVVRAAFGPVTFFFILKLKILAMRKIKQRYMKCILPETSNVRNKNPNQSSLGKTLMTAVRSPARRLVIEFLIGCPPYSY